MPWRGPEIPGEFPTLGPLVAEWIQAHCAQPDRHIAGQPFSLVDEQYRHLLWEYRLHEAATVDLDAPAAPFVYDGNVLVRPQKWGKGPFSAARICAQAAGPVLFAGWAEGGEETDWGYVYEEGEPMGMPWATPIIQVAALAEEQTNNIWRALLPMIRKGAISAEIDDTGLQKIYLPDDGVIERVTSKAPSKQGSRTTYAEIDETSELTKSNGGRYLVNVMRRNIAGTGGRWSATSNAYDPAQGSVCQVDVENKKPGVYVNYPKPLEGSWANKRDRRRILKNAYKGIPWVDVNRVESECASLDAEGESAQGERFYGNRIVAGADRAFDLLLYKKLAVPEFDESHPLLVPKPENAIERGRLVTLGFDGALTQDATGLVATDVESGHQTVVGVWERPANLPPEDDSWMVDVDDVYQTVDWAFDFWNVWRLYADPPHWKDDINKWAGLYGEDKVVLWWTNQKKRMAYALLDFKTAMRPGVMSHDGNEALVRHVGNAVKRLTRMRDDSDRFWLWVIGKDGEKSAHKIDLAMAACLSWAARGDAIRAGVINEPEYESAAW